jgi:oxygen-independent coproporphyrinogen-3 oxidase
MSSAVSPAALYVHFPFCLSICPYCDFVVYGGRAARGPTNQVDAFLTAVLAEISLRGVRASLRSVYLGGGTPSLMSAQQIDRLLRAVDQSFGIAQNPEITLEVNPGAGERGDLAGFRAAGVNRLSIGAQSLDAGELKRLGRRHSPADIRVTMSAARAAGFDNISLDLLYDVPGQTLASWRATLAGTLALEPEHVSAYALSLDDPDADGLTEPTGDHLSLRAGARRWRTMARTEQDHDRAAEMYEMADDAFAAAGLEWYEISNWSRPGRESRHNLTYWLGGAWEAVGPGAHAFDGDRTRRWNAARLDGYLAALTPTDGSPSRLPPGGVEISELATGEAESLILPLRTRDGLPSSFAPRLKWASVQGLVEPAPDGRIRLTREGRLLSNEIFVRLLPDQSAAA